jgi:hypothetical protein
MTGATHHLSQMEGVLRLFTQLLEGMLGEEEKHENGTPV